jgi:hypothetical protein
MEQLNNSKSNSPWREKNPEGDYEEEKMKS